MRHAIAALSLAALGSLGHPGSASAAVVDYDESVSGDLSRTISGQTPTVFNLGAGSNTVRGTVDYQPGADGGENTIDWDSFSFIVAPEHSLASIALRVTGTHEGNTGWLVRSGSTVAGQGTILDALYAFTPADSTALDGPFGAGAFYVTLYSIGMLGTTNYEFTLAVTDRSVPDVPEPATLALLGLGVAGFGFATVRRRRA
jgi:hypothetical protein